MEKITHPWHERIRLFPASWTRTSEARGPPGRQPGHPGRPAPHRRRRRKRSSSPSTTSKRSASSRNGATISRRRTSSSPWTSSRKAPPTCPGGLRPSEPLNLSRKSVHPKSLNQQAYIQAIKTHDLVFGIGPAGTGQDLPGHGHGPVLPPEQGRQPHHPDPPGRRGRREARLPARRHHPEGQPLSPAPLRRPLRPVPVRPGQPPDREGHHRDRPPGLHARPDPEQRLHHPRRGPEHDPRADEDDPDPGRASIPSWSSRPTSPRSTSPSRASPASSRPSRSCRPSRRSPSSISTTGTSSATPSSRRSSRPTRRPRPRPRMTAHATSSPSTRSSCSRGPRSSPGRAPAEAARGRRPSLPAEKFFRSPWPFIVLTSSSSFSVIAVLPSGSLSSGSASGRSRRPTSSPRST